MTMVGLSIGGPASVSATSQVVVVAVDAGADAAVMQPAVRGAMTQVRALPPICTPGELVRGVDVGSRKLTAFSFDDGPWPGATKQIMTKFEARGARATFFVIGKMVNEYPEITKDIVGRGHAIGNHTMTHSYDPVRIASEVAATNKLLADLTGVAPVIFRSPGLTKDDRIQSELAARGMCNIFTTAILGDVDLPRPSPADLCSRFAANLHPGQITLLHDGGGDHQATVDAVDCMLDVAVRRGYTLLTVPELLVQGTHYSGPRPRNDIGHDPPIGARTPLGE